MTVTYQSLLQSRSYFNEATQTWRPKFWEPLPVKSVPHSLFGDDSMLCEPEWNVNSAVQKLIALGLYLELPVGEWVTEARKQDNISPIVLKLLHTNIADEAKHDLGFRYANQAYSVSEEIMSEAKNIAQTWINSESHVLERAALIETGVFLCSLGFIRLAGGSELCTMAEKISIDESRHVSTNRGVLSDLGFDLHNPSKVLRDLIYQTLDWAFDGVCVPGDAIGEDYDVDKAFLISSSDELIATGTAKRLDELMTFAHYSPPFEVSNRQYSIEYA